jgi:hypothetical protein
VVDPEADEHTKAEETMMRRCCCKATEMSVHFRWTVASACAWQAWYGWTHDQRTPRLVLAKLQRDEGSKRETVSRFMCQVWTSNTYATNTNVLVVDNLHVVVCDNEFVRVIVRSKER